MTFNLRPYSVDNCAGGVVEAGSTAHARTRFFVVSCSCYLLLLLVVAITFDDWMVWSGVLFVFLNFFISTATGLFIRFTASWPFYTLIYSVFVIVYVVKAIHLYAIGLNTEYSLHTIRNTLTPEDYRASLNVVTAGHAILATVIVVATAWERNKPVAYGCLGYPSRASTGLMLLLLLVWTIGSSLIMYAYSVALMGSTNVSLPFKLSGVLFYSRTIVVPMILLVFVEKAQFLNDAKLLRNALTMFGVLAASEVVVRATKSPLFILMLQLAFLRLMLIANGYKPKVRFSTRTIVICLVVSLLLFPAMEIYRTIIAVDDISIGFSAAMDEYTGPQNQNMLVATLEKLFMRLLGFLQLAGLISDMSVPHDLSLLPTYEGIAGYYTQYYLRYTQAGHMSSPSLLGACIIIGGQHFWPLVFGTYLVLMILIWRFAVLFPRMVMPIRCFLAAEAFNTIMAGTMDLSLYRIGLVFSIAACWEGFQTISGGRRLSQLSSVQENPRTSP